MAVATTNVPLALAAVLLVTGLCVDACSPHDGERELSLAEMVQASDTVIYGEVRRTIPDPRFDYGSGISDVYTAEMIVFCVIRGRRTKALINVTEAGSVPGLCVSTEYLVGERYIVMLRRDRNRLTPAYAELPATQRNLIDATNDCSLRIQYPRGVNSATAAIKCPVDNTHLSCDEDKDYDVDIEPTPRPRRPTPTPHATRAPRPPTATTTTTAAPPKGDKCGDEEATNVISEDDCGPRVNTVKSHATRTITHSLLLCFIVLMATVVIEC